MTQLATPPLHDAPSPATDPVAPDRGLVRLPTGAAAPRRRGAGILVRLLIPVSILAAWWILTGTGAIPATTLSTPAATWDAFVDLLRHQDLLGDIAVSVRRAALGLALGAGVGLVLGIVVGLTRLGEELLDAPLQMLRMVPYPAVIFLFIIWFGIGEAAKVLLIALATLFPMYLNTSNGVRNVDRRVVEAARSFGVGGRRLVRQVIVPLAMPSILTGLRFSAGISVIALVFTESLGANQGIGYLVSQADSLQQIPVLVVCVVIYALLGIAADLLVRLLERVTMPWRRHGARPMTLVSTAPAAVALDVAKSFGDRTVLHDLDVTVARGEFVALLGASGSGKTTLLRILAGLEPASAGEVLVPEVRTVVYQEPRLVASMRVWRNVVLGLPRAAATRSAATASLREVGLDQQANAWPGTFSGGEAQRVALARALVREPELLLLDEPFAALDALTRLKMQDLVAALCARHRPGVLLVTHDVEEAVRLADRVLVLREGRICLDVAVELPRPRRASGAAFDALRDRLLAELGVVEGLAFSG